MADNADIRGMIRDLALKRDSIDRRQLYFALVQAEVWVPVSAKSAAGHVTPGDLQPLDREALGGLAAFAFFTHLDAAEGWQKEEAGSEQLRLEHMAFVDLLPLLLDAGAGSAFVNPAAKFTGELYRHELQTILDGARRLAARTPSKPSVESAEPAEAADPSPPRSWWQRLLGR